MSQEETVQRRQRADTSMPTDIRAARVAEHKLDEWDQRFADLQSEEEGKLPTLIWKIAKAEGAELAELEAAKGVAVARKERASGWLTVLLDAKTDPENHKKIIKWLESFDGDLLETDPAATVAGLL